MKNKKTLGNLILLFTAFVWGMAFAFQSQAGELLGPFTIAGARMTMAAVEIGILCIVLDAIKKRKITEDKASKSKAINTLKGGLLCGLFLGFGTILQQKGIEYTSAGKAGFITALYILFVPIFSIFILKKKASIKVWIAVFIALVGMYLLTMSSAEGIGAGDIYVLVCAVFFSFQILAADYYTPKADPIKLAEIQFIFVAIVSWILAFIFETPSIDAIKEAMIPLLYCGLISGGVGYTLQMVGQKYADPTPASLCMSFESVFSVVGGAIILHEMMTGREILGCVIMFVAIILVQLPDKRRK